MVKTAVLMATYNGEKFLKNQLDSILQQSHMPDYVVFRDDGSTDGTIEYLDKYIQEHGLENWVIHRNEKNLGWYLNFRELLKDGLATGAEVVFFSDQDDTWAGDKIERQLEIMKDDKVEVLSGDVTIKTIGEGATVPKYYEFEDKDQKLSKYPVRTDYYASRPAWTLALKNSFVSEVMRYWAEDYNYIAHDVLFESLGCLTETAYNLNESVGTHLRHGGNASGMKKDTDFSIHSSKARHVSELYRFYGFYDIISKVLSERDSLYSPEIRAYRDFYKKRFEHAEKNNLLASLSLIFTGWKYYPGMPGRIRDFIFAFKK